MGLKAEDDTTEATGASRCFKGSFILLLLNVSFVSPVGGFSLRSCRISNHTAICSSNTAVPRDIPPTVLGIDLSSNKIKILQPDDFKSFSLVVQLKLNRNKITQIYRGAFSGLSSLEKLNLNNNMLVELDEDVFQGLSRLTELRINKNHIAKVAPTALVSMRRLELLDVSSNNLRQVQVQVMLQHLPHLEELYLGANSLTMFRSWELTNTSVQLRYLDLFHNPIRVFSISADVFPQLTWLRLGASSGHRQVQLDVRNGTFLSRVSSLDISGLSMALGDVRALLEMMNSSLTFLRMNTMKGDLGRLVDASCAIPTMSNLQLQQNQLVRVSADLFRLCVNVTELDLSRNKIRVISDDAFRSMKGLRVLSLSRNNLSAVPAATRNLPVLTELDLSFCGISVLRCEDFANQTRLRNLYLYNNSISLLSECVFKDLRQLRILKFQTNRIVKINKAFSRYLPSLRMLHLNGNQLAEIRPNDLKGLVSLQNLSLHSNQIRKLHKWSFAGLTNLTDLNLQKNLITEPGLRTGAFNVLVNLRTLDLTDNQIKYGNGSLLSHPPFSKLSRLQKLSLRGQGLRGWTFLPRNLLQGLSGLLEFNTRNVRLEDLHRDMFAYTPRLENLDINSNSPSSFPSDLFSLLGYLKSLYISKTSLQSLDCLVHGNLAKLEFVQARSNQFSVIQEDVIKSLPSLIYLDLQGNSFTCDCDNAWLVQWIQNTNQTQVFDAYNFKCNYPPTRRGSRLLDFDVRQCLLADYDFICFIVTTCAILCFMAAPFIYHFTRWQLVYTYYIFLAWLADTKHKNKGAAHEYDAFVSYNAHDEPWVIEQLLPKLEGDQGWRLCLHHRDFEPGKPIISNITDAIYGSRKTICVISHRYLQSEWCSREIQAASFRLFDEKKDVLILVFLEEIPGCYLSPYHRMRKLLKRQTYLSWPRVGQHAQVFWEQLRRALQSGAELDPDQLLTLTVRD